MTVDLRSGGPKKRCVDGWLRRFGWTTSVGSGSDQRNSEHWFLEIKAELVWGIFRWSSTTPKIPKVLLEVKDFIIRLE